MTVSAARAAAFEVLLRVEKEDAYASELLHASRFDHLSRVDHALLTELVMGVLRWRATLDAATYRISGFYSEKFYLCLRYKYIIRRRQVVVIG